MLQLVVGHCVGKVGMISSGSDALHKRIDTPRR